MRISDWSSDVCSSDLNEPVMLLKKAVERKLQVFVPIRARDPVAHASIGQHIFTGAYDVVLDAASVKQRFTRVMKHPLLVQLGYSWETRRVGKECVRPCRTRWPSII